MPMLAYVLIIVALILVVAQLRRSARIKGTDMERVVSLILLIALMSLVVWLMLMLAWGTEVRRF